MICILFSVDFITNHITTTFTENPNWFSENRSVIRENCHDMWNSHLDALANSCTILQQHCTRLHCNVVRQNADNIKMVVLRVCVCAFAVTIFLTVEKWTFLSSPAEKFWNLETFGIFTTCQSLYTRDSV
jgi:hypothetical protein